MTARRFTCLAVAVLIAPLRSATAARPGKAEQHRKEEEDQEVVQLEEEQGAGPKRRFKQAAAVLQKRSRAKQLPEGGGGDDAAAEKPKPDEEELPKPEPTGTKAYHLTPDGAKACDFGVTVTETKCKAVGEAILQDMKVKPGRTYLVSGKMANAPPGCSIHTGMDFAVTYNTNTEGDNDGGFASICHGKKEEVHGVKEGESECDFGEPVKVDKCLDAINSVLHTIAGADATEQITVNVGHWNTLPAGCSMHVGAGSQEALKGAEKVAFFNTKADAKNDGSYVLVCTGTVVPVR